MRRPVITAGAILGRSHAMARAPWHNFDQDAADRRYDEGWRARAKGVALGLCPFDAGSDGWHDWRTGWQDADVFVRAFPGSRRNEALVAALNGGSR